MFKFNILKNILENEGIYNIQSKKHKNNEKPVYMLEWIPSVMIRLINITKKINDISITFYYSSFYDEILLFV